MKFEVGDVFKTTNPNHEGNLYYVKRVHDAGNIIDCILVRCPILQDTGYEFNAIVEENEWIKLPIIDEAWGEAFNYFYLGGRYYAE